MPTHTTVKVTYNPLNSQVYTHRISETQIEICIVGEDTQVSGIRLRPLSPQGAPVVGTQEVQATL
jgi:hypothetical protein